MKIYELIIPLVYITCIRITQLANWIFYVVLNGYEAVNNVIQFVVFSLGLFHGRCTSRRAYEKHGHIGSEW